MGIFSDVLNGFGLYTKNQYTNVVTSAIKVVEKAEEMQGLRSTDSLRWGGMIAEPQKFVKKDPVNPFKVLRALRKTVPIIGICVSSIKRDICLSEWQLVVEDGVETSGTNAMVKKITHLFTYMNRNQDNFRLLLNRVLEDVLVLDAGVIEKVSDLSGEVRELFHIDGSCYSDDTEVLTKEGWKLFKDVDISVDEFATRNNQTKNFEWQKATYNHVEDYSGDMYSFSSRCTDVLVTENHRMLVCKDRSHGSPDIVMSAKEVYDNYNSNWSLPATSNWIGESPDKIVINSQVNHKLSKSFECSVEDFCAFMGMYLADGCISLTGRKNTIYVSQPKESKGYTKFRELLIKIVGKEPYYDGRAWQFKNKTLYDYLSRFGKALDKYIPEEILSLKKEHLGVFWDYYMLGDGNFDGNRQRISTSSKRMADDMLELLQKLGYSGSIVTRVPKGSVFADGRVIEAKNCADGYVISRRTSAYHSFTVEKENYEGKVYCVSVPNEFLYVRRNGKPTWCGNTIRPRVNAYGEYDTEKAYVQILEGSNEEKASFRLDELIYIMQNPHSEMAYYGYGFSPIEQVRLAVEASLSAELYNINQMKENNVPAGLLDLGDMTTEEVQSFRQMWEQTTQGNFPQIKFLFGGSGPRPKPWHPFKTSSREMEYMKYVEWLSRIVLASFGLSGMDANMVHDLNKANAEVQRAVSQSRGVESLKRIIEEYINREVILEGFGVDNIKFEFSRPKTLSPRDQAEIDAIYLKAGVTFPDEVRTREGMSLKTETKQELYGDATVDDFGQEVIVETPVDTSQDATKTKELACAILKSREQYLKKIPQNS